MAEKSTNCLDRQISSYPNPKYYAMFIADCYKNNENKSSMLEVILRNRYDNMPPAEQDKLLREYETLSDKERRNPGRRGH